MLKVEGNSEGLIELAKSLISDGISFSYINGAITATDIPHETSLMYHKVIAQSKGYPNLTVTIK